MRPQQLRPQQLRPQQLRPQQLRPQQLRPQQQGHEFSAPSWLAVWVSVRAESSASGLIEVSAENSSQ